MRAFTEPIYQVSERMLDNVTRARNQLKAGILSSQNSMSSVATEIGSQLLTLGRRMPKEEIMARLGECRRCGVAVYGRLGGPWAPEGQVTAR